MRLYFYGSLLLIRKFILRQNTGAAICWFAERMGVVYIKLAQILAMQNYQTLFTEDDRQHLARICDHCNPIPFAEIQRQLEAEYGCPLSAKFREIDPQPLGSASISQVHRAVLLDGRAVAVKVKRQDVVRRVKHDTDQLRRLMCRFGRFFKFRNIIGGNTTLTLLVNWIEQETDFRHEQQNITNFATFAKQVNGQIAGLPHIVTPQLFPEFCTANVIVMEYISHPTLNQLQLDPAHKAQISTGMNAYLRLSFHALLHNIPVVFHGDPHGGNIYLDSAGNIGFLDFGLIFEFTAHETDLIRQLFLFAYSGQADQIVQLLLPDSICGKYDETKLLADIRAKTDAFHDVPVSQYFVEMIGIFTQYNISPPEFLFKAAKAFIALFGIGTFAENFTNTQQLLSAQVAEYYFTRTVDDFTSLARSGLSLLPHFFQNSLQHGVIHAISQEFTELERLSGDLRTTLDRCHEAFTLFAPKR